MKRVVRIIIAAIGLLLVALIGAGLYFYDYAVVPNDKDFIASGTDQKEITQDEEWFRDPNNRSRWNLTSRDQLSLSAIYLPADTDTGKTALIAHGYMSNAEEMWKYAKMYHDMGYHVLLPDARGHGESEGDYIGFGWDERLDYLDWIDKVLQENGADEELTLFGISMGGATVMMTSGEEMPVNVKAIVEDCGYSSIKAELSYQLDDMFGLPSFPLLEVTSLVTKVRAGYFFGSGDAVKQLKKNTTPILFIHGDEDTFVPYSMLETVYEATDAPKEKYTVAGAEHAKSYDADPDMYKQVISTFLDTYLH